LKGSRFHGGPATYLFAARALRDFGDGFAAVLLPAYLLALGMTPLEVGIISTASLLGTACLVIGVGFLGGSRDHRQLLLAAAGLLIATGLAYASIHVFALLLIVAFVGTVNPSAGSASVFVPLEHAVLANEVDDATRTRSFGNYSLVGALAASAGALFAGLPDLLTRMNVERTTAIAAMFVLYAVLGLAGGSFYRRLPRTRDAPPEARKPALGPSRGIVMKLAALFSLDAFAGGFVVQSLLALWLFEKFHMPLYAVATFFFWTGLLSAFSFPVAVWLSRRIGLLNTMVFTHIPSSIALILAALSPSLPLVLALLLVRAALSQMDVPTRSSYLMAVVTGPERAAAASFTSVPRSLAAAGSPAIAGALFAAAYQSLPLVICGALKITYDLLLLRQFRSVKPPEEQ
jgi:MFS family permease